MTHYRARYLPAATGPAARYAGKWASLVYTDRDALAAIVAECPNAEHMEIVEVRG